MGDDWVGQSSFPEDNNGSVKEDTPFSFSEVFHKSLPQFMALGMSPTEFWDGDYDLAKSYYDAHKLKAKLKNEELWLQGLYIYEALCDASPLFRTNFKGGQVKPIPYRNKPYEFDNTSKHEEKKSNYTSNLDMVKTWANIHNERGG